MQVQTVSRRDECEEQLICLPELIFDRPKINGQIEAISNDTALNEAAKREAVLQVLRAAKDTGTKAIAAHFANAPRAAREATFSYTWLTDNLVETVFAFVITTMHPDKGKKPATKISALALGGYGRGEMAPFSDVDLLFLISGKQTNWAEAAVEKMLYLFWDLRLKVGHATRSIDDCLNLGKEDFTIRTSMLESRYICGDVALAKKLQARLEAELFTGSEREFIEAKLAERLTRHQKQGGQRYMVEPNVKEGKGGLRDLQSMFWIAKYVHHTSRARDLVELGVIHKDEMSRINRAYDFLWAVRCHLHLAAGRAVEQLTFDMQIQVAHLMGYDDHAGRRAVEHFMQDYFRHATSVGDFTRIFLTSLEAEHKKAAPLIKRLFHRRRRVKAGFEVVHNRLAVIDDKAFLSDKLNLLRIFEEGLRTGLLIHPEAMRLVVKNLKLIDDDMRNDKKANKLFLDLLLKHGNPERALRRMNELGVLSAFVPEFEPIVAMMQFNMYHHYTVDEHTIQCISHLARIERGELGDELPISTEIIKSGLDRKVLYVALLLHDIGKGRDEDHAILGARIARKVAPRFGLKKSDAETVEWLVRMHLLMSDMAQKRDIADPRTVRDFAKAVQTVKRLNLLTVLTVCDIRGVGPGTWNNWKASLIRALYRQTRRVLENGFEDLTRELRGNEAKSNLRAALPDWDARAIKHETSRHYEPYWQGLHVTAHVAFAKLLRDLNDDEIGVDVFPDTDRDATRACFALADHPGIFSRLAGALALVGANVVDARTYTSKDGYATAAFWIQDQYGHPYEVSRLPRLRQMIERILKGEVVAREELKDRDTLKKRERAFKVPTSITFDNDGSEIYTIIEVDTRDRPGLLHDLTRTLAANNVYIASAVIATYGEQAVDAFYVKDMFGLKFHSESKRRNLEKKLRAAIEKENERAAQ